MGIGREIDALRRQMLAESQRDVDAMGEVARVFMGIEEARRSGYAHLARVFSEPQATPEPKSQIYAGPLQSGLVEERRPNNQYPSYPPIVEGDTEPVLSAEEEAWYRSQAEDLARRLAPNGRYGSAQ